MSILQEYAWIRKNIGEKTFQDIELFLEKHPELFLSDVYYKEAVWKQFEAERVGGKENV
jgi:hypothetical protein